MYSVWTKAVNNLFKLGLKLTLKICQSSLIIFEICIFLQIQLVYLQDKVFLLACNDINMMFLNDM